MTLSLAPAPRVFVALKPVDLRRGFNGLSAYVQSVMGQALTGGAMFVFTNRRHNRIKVLWWDGSGLILLIKRPERGRFTWPQGQGTTIGLRPEALTALITGLEVREKKGWLRR
jgi:transposase